ncbi:MAG TPA: ABC transporter permease subunit [Nitrospirales bacterium]|nr:ABC transporter permease subunit [Nitrospirales bacterium]
MTPVNALAAKELRTNLVSPIVYVVGAVFLFIFGLLAYVFLVNAGLIAVREMQFQNAIAQLNLNDLMFRPIFGFMVFLLMLIIPLLTMRVLAEEKKLRTYEMLMTAPIHLHEVVVGKFLALLAIFLGLLACTMIVPASMSIYSSFDWRTVWTGYLGITLVGALFLSVGLFTSSLTENQIIASMISFGLLFMVWLLGALGAIMGDTTFGHVLSYLSFVEHFDRLNKGLVESKDLIYFASGIIFMLFLTYRVVESQRWK